MSDISERISSLSAAKRALLERRLIESEGVSAAVESIAIIGMGCRFPGGANSPQAFWQNLVDGVDAIIPVPPDRWDNDAFCDPGTATPDELGMRWGGFVNDAGQFDPAFFGISPKEAVRMDPQQRMLLEVAWESLEEAGVPAENLRGSSTGVFIGVQSQSIDYYLIQLADIENVEFQTNTGGAHSIIANRLSYFLDLRGPSFTVDTACSSSLVALHVACQSLKTRECDLAFAGGTNLMAVPETSMAYTKLTFMAPDGRCKTFDARANGFVRGEGCGVVLLKRLSEAVKDHDPIIAVIRGTAVNQDGTTNGLTSPNGLSQQSVIRIALRNAGVEPSQIGYIEAHGTGTSLGDPIEVEALSNVLAAGSNDGQPCYLGAVKTNIGHLESAAGIAGIIKAALCLRHRFIPPNLHFKKLNPHITLEGTRFRIPTEGQTWNIKDRPRFAGISSFGFGGTNGHAILEEAPAVSTTEEAREADPPERVLTISARNRKALGELVGAYISLLHSEEGKTLTPHDIAFTASLRRSHLPARVAVVGRTHEDWAQGLQQYSNNQENSWPGSGRQGIAVGNGSVCPRLVFVFSGQGPQWYAMGRELFEREPVYRSTIERCASLLSPYTESAPGGSWNLLDELNADEQKSRLAMTAIAQPALFALQIALFELFKSWGVRPDYIIGHSVGEVTAACAAGVLVLEDAVRVIYHRARVMQQATGKGNMAAIGMSEQQTAEEIKGFEEKLVIGAINSPSSVVLSGESEALKAMLKKLDTRGIFNRMLPVNYAFHSPVMESYKAELSQALDGIEPQTPIIPIVSTVTGCPVAEGDYGPGYWGRNIREPVRFADAVQRAIDLGGQLFLEIGPHPVLASPLSQCLTKVENAAVLPSLRRESPERATLLTVLRGLFANGYPVDWNTFFPKGGRCVSLPRYPWQHSVFWFNTPGLRGIQPLSLRGGKGQLNTTPLLGRMRSQIEARLQDESDPESLVLDIRIYDDSGHVVAESLNARPDVCDRNALVSALTERSADKLYEVRWIEREKSTTVGNAAFRGVAEASPSQLLQGLEVELEDLRSQVDFRDYEKLAPELKALSVKYILQALRELQWHPKAGAAVSLESLQQETGVLEKHCFLLREMLFILESEGIVKGNGKGWEVSRELESLDGRVGDLDKRHPAYEELLNTLERCGENLADVLRGKQDPLQILFPSGSLDSAEKFYRDLPIYNVWSRVIRSVFRKLVALLPKGRKVRILEIGAGTGGTTSYVAPILDPNRTDYVFTDLSKWFLMEAKRRFREFPFIRYEIFDAEKAPSEQGFEEGTFDLVLAANVLHATRNLRETLQNVLRLLSPEGVLVQLEVTARVAWNDLLFGITEGWWRFEDHDLRPNHALLAPESWLRLYKEVGFTDAAAIPNHVEHEGKTFPQAVLIARAPSVPTKLSRAEVKTEKQQIGWVVFADQAGVGEAFAAEIKEHGDTVVQVSYGGENLSKTGSNSYQLPAGSPDQFNLLVRDVTESTEASAWRMAYFWGLDATEPIGGNGTIFDEKRLLGCDSALWLAQAMQEDHGEKSMRLWLVTRGAQAVKNTKPRYMQAPLWGLGRTLAFEMPDVWGGLVDLEDDGDLKRSSELLLEEMIDAGDEDQVVFREGTRLVPRLYRMDDAEQRYTGSLCDYDGTYLVTGATDGLGVRVASWLAEQGARQLLVVGQAGDPPNTERAKEIVHSIENLGAKIRIVEGDPADRETLTRIFDGFGKNAPPLKGIIHAGGMVDPVSASRIDLSRLSRTFDERAKVAWLLHTLSQKRELDFFVLFSSASAIMGSRDLGHFGAANHFLDVLACARKVNGLPALSVDWGWWPEGGTAESLDAYYPKIGLHPISTDDAFIELARLLRIGCTQAAIMSVDWSIFKPISEAKGPVPFLESISVEKPESEKEVESEDTDFRRIWAETLPQERWDILVAHVKEHLSYILGFEDTDSIDIKEGFFNLGMDSITTLQFTGRLERSIGYAFPATLAFEYPNIESLCRHIVEDVLGEESTMAEEVETVGVTDDVSMSEIEEKYGQMSEEDLVSLLNEKLRSLNE